MVDLSIQADAPDKTHVLSKLKKVLRFRPTGHKPDTKRPGLPWTRPLYYILIKANLTVKTTMQKKLSTEALLRKLIVEKLLNWTRI